MKERSSEFRSWDGMQERCRNPRHTAWHNYGGRGIRVCERWASFASFLADMGPKPSRAHTLDRIDNDGNYEPGNCRWATRSEQARNRRTGRQLCAFGRTQLLCEWARETGVSGGLILGRLSLGWTPEEAVSTKPRKWRGVACRFNGVAAEGAKA